MKQIWIPPCPRWKSNSQVLFLFYDLVCKQLINALAQTRRTNGHKKVTCITGESTESCQGWRDGTFHEPWITFCYLGNTIVHIFFFPFTVGLDHVEEMFQTFLMAYSDDRNVAAGRWKEMTPLPMNSMLNRESKADTVNEKNDRSKKVVEDVPPSLPHLVSVNS